jgi:beta-glucosidase
VELSVDVADLASFDDLGKIAPCAWVLEKGTYRFYLGTSVRDAAELAYTYEQAENRVVSQLSSSLAPTDLA